MKKTANAIRTAVPALLVAVAALAACSANTAGPASSAGCGVPPPSPVPQLRLVYPIPSATSVPVAIGLLIFANNNGIAPQEAVSLVPAGSSGSGVPVGAFTAAPSPLPSPRVTPGGNFGQGTPYVAVPVPALSPTTTYSVAYSYQDWADTPPTCTATHTQDLGTFSTE